MENRDENEKKDQGQFDFEDSGLAKEVIGGEAVEFFNSDDVDDQKGQVNNNFDGGNDNGSSLSFLC